MRRGQQGMTLIELVVAMSIGLFLIGGALYVYSQSKNTYRAGDSLARLQESARFALDTLEPDIRLARFWGRSSSRAAVDVPAGITAKCVGGVDVTDWALGSAATIEVRDDTYDLDCSAYKNDPRPGSDVLILRHAEPWSGGVPPAPENGRIQLQTSLAARQLFNDGLPPDLEAAEATTHNLVVNAYYVSQQSSFDTNQPSLRRLSMDKNGTLLDEEVIPGVENLQVQLGVDNDGDGAMDQYVDGDRLNPDATIVAVRIWMLVGTPADDQGWTDARSYPTPDADLGNLAAGTPAYPAKSRRLQIAKTIYLNNQGA